MKKILLWSSALALTVGLGANAQAQEATSGEGIGEIVITAQFRQQSLQDAPIAVDAVRASELEAAGVTDLNTMSRLVPAVQIGQPAGPSSIIFIRGIGSLTANSFTDPAVGVSYDGVPLSRPYSVNGRMYDLQRVEVLKGPQGTLFGRNSVSGAINILPQAPELGVFGGSLGFDVGNYDSLRLNAALNAPIGEIAAVRGAMQIIQHDGYNSDGTADEESQGGRIQFLIEPTPTLSVRIGADYFHIGGRGNGGVVTSLGYNVEDRVGPADPRLSDGVGGNDWPLGFDDFEPGDQYADNTHWGVNATINWETEIGTFTVIPAYRKDDLDYFSAGAGLGLDYSGEDPQFANSEGSGETNEQTSLEIRLASPEDQRLVWVLGAYGLTTESNSDLQIDSRFTFPDPRSAATSWQDFISSEDSWAVFADGTFNLTDTLRLIGGIRYTEVEKTGTGSFLTGAGSLIALPSSINTISWDSTTWRAGLQWDVTDDSMLYATVATGWHAGGYSFFEGGYVSGPVGEGQFLYEPEEITALTIGSKNRFFDGRLLANLEVFRWEITDQQVSAVNLSLPSGGTTLRTFNIGESVVEGAELELEFMVAENTRLNAQFQYLDNTYESLVYTQFTVTPVADFNATNECAQSLPGGPVISRDCSGVTAPQSPEWTINLGVEQTIPLTTGASIVANLSGHYESERRTAFDFTPGALVDSVVTADASLAYRSADEKWALTAYVNNFTDEAVIHNQFTFPPTGVTVAQVRPPRTYGVRLVTKF